LSCQASTLLSTNDEEGNPRGSHKTLKTDVDVLVGVKKQLYCCAWKDFKTKYLICTRGTTLQGPQYIRRRDKVIEVDGTRVVQVRDLAIDMLICVHEFFNAFNKIDVHDHVRQGIIDFETFRLTKIW
jgi:hypothetical protein